MRVRRMSGHRNGRRADLPGTIRWQCPFCGHSLEYAQQHESAAKLAMVSHLVRCHRMNRDQVLARLGKRYAGHAATELFGGPKEAGADDCAAGYIRFSP